MATNRRGNRAKRSIEGIADAPIDPDEMRSEMELAVQRYRRWGGAIVELQQIERFVVAAWAALNLDEQIDQQRIAIVARAIRGERDADTTPRRTLIAAVERLASLWWFRFETDAEIALAVTDVRSQFWPREMPAAIDTPEGREKLVDAVRAFRRPRGRPAGSRNGDCTSREGVIADLLRIARLGTIDDDGVRSLVRRRRKK